MWQPAGKEQHRRLILCLLLTGLVLPFALIGGGGEGDAEYDRLDQQWRRLALSNGTIRDRRADDDQLRSLMNYEDELIVVDNYKNERGQVLTGRGWQLEGSVVDVLEHKNTIYVLYGRRNLYFLPGLWNNKLDEKRSFQDFFVVKRMDKKAEIITQQVLTQTTSEVRLGLRPAGNSGLEVLQNVPRTQQSQVIWFHPFDK